MRGRGGFTLIEVLVVITLIGIIAGMTVVLGGGVINLQEFERMQVHARQALITAQEYTVSGKDDDTWGVAFTTSSITRFKGANYASRDPSYDVTTNFAGKGSFSGTSEVVFTKPLGKPVNEAIIVITQGSRVSTGTVNAVGTIGFSK